MITDAISQLKERNGSSRQAIKKYIVNNYKVKPSAHFDSQFNLALRRGAESNAFVQPKGRSRSLVSTLTGKVPQAP